MSSLRFRIRLKSFDHRLLDDAARQVLEAIKRSGAIVHGPIPLPVRTERFTVLVSPNADKDARDQYEIRTYKRIIDIVEATDSTTDHLRDIKLPEGIQVAVETY